MTDRHPIAIRLTALLLGMGLLGTPLTGAAQSLRPAGQLSLGRTVQAAPAGPRTADFIVALVNSEPVTNSEVRQRLLRVEQQMVQQRAALPPREELARQVLEQLISERAQLQHASQIGLRVDDAAVLQAERSVAAQNQLSLEEFRRRASAEGVDLNRFRSELRSQLLLQRVREREVDARVQVSEADIDDFIREQQSQSDPQALALNLAHVLILVPEGSSEAQIQALQARAQTVADRARAGADFAELAREFSQAAEGARGGEFGLRPAARLPELFVEGTRNLPTGGIAGPLRSPAGFHVLKVLEKRQAGLPDVNVTQTRARHILLRPGPQLSQTDALARLAQWRDQMQTGKASFEALAREHSQDGSASEGGDLGWASPGQFVPEFEEVMNALVPGQVSQPLVSRFGVHLIRVDQRRQVALSQREQRDIVRNLVREKKAEEALQTWALDLRSRAFVELREAPQP